MHSFRIDQLRMMGTLSPWLEANRTAIEQSKIAGREAEDVIQGLPAVQAKAGLTATETKTVTQRRQRQAKEFQSLVLALVGPLSMVATAKDDVKLLGLVTLGRSAFKRLRPSLQAEVGNEILTRAQEHATALADHGLTPAFFTSARATTEGFRAGLPDTQLLLDARQNANATYEEVHAAQMQQIGELDLAMGVFEVLNPELYRGYKTARALLSTGGKAGKKSPDAPDVPQK